MQWKHNITCSITCNTTEPCSAKWLQRVPVAGQGALTIQVWLSQCSLYSIHVTTACMLPWQTALHNMSVCEKIQIVCIAEENVHGLIALSIQTMVAWDLQSAGRLCTTCLLIGGQCMLQWHVVYSAAKQPCQSIPLTLKM